MRANSSFHHFSIIQVKIRFDLEQIGTKTFIAIFASIRCMEQHTIVVGASGHANSFFFLHSIQDGRYNHKIYFVSTNAKFHFHERAIWL